LHTWRDVGRVVVKSDGCIRFVQFSFDVLVCVNFYSLFGVCKLDVRGSVHHSIIHKENPTRCNSVSDFFISYLYEAQRVSGDTPLIIRGLKMH
jgi:hypothetical protein